MGVSLSDDEAWAFLEEAHTGILTSLRRDGWPVSLPVWFAVLDRRIVVRTLRTSKKVARIEADERVSFLVETGTAWAELKAVVVTGTARVLTHDAAGQPDFETRVLEAIDAKYAAHRRVAEKVPEATDRHYRQPYALVEVCPAQPFLSWDNARLRQPGGSA